MEKNKSLMNLLAAHAQKSTGQGVCRRPQFLAMKELIEDALHRGWSMKAIWEVLYEQKKFTGRYNCFAIYVRRYIKRAAKAEGLPDILDSEPQMPPSFESQEKTSKAERADISVASVQSSKGNWKPETESDVFDYDPKITEDKRKKLFGPKENKKQEDSHG